MFISLVKDPNVQFVRVRQDFFALAQVVDTEKSTDKKKTNITGGKVSEDLSL